MQRANRRIALHLQRFPTRGQNVDIFRLPVEQLGERGDRFNDMLAAVENDKELSRTNQIEDLLPLAGAILEALETIHPGQTVAVLE